MTDSHIRLAVNTTMAKLPLSKTPSAPRADRRQRRSADIRERLFRAALKLFGEKGFAETTVEDITNAADVGKGTFFNYFPSKDHILIAFSEMQISKLQASVDGMREHNQPIPDFLATLTVRMTEEPARAPDVVRAILQAYLSTTTVRSVMRENQARAHGLLTQVVQLGQERGDFRRDLPAGELAQVFRQTVFGTLLMWSLFGDASLPERIHTALQVLWKGLAPRDPGPQSPTASSEEEVRLR
jgi:AcrR family transcriptional regulator